MGAGSSLTGAVADGLSSTGSGGSAGGEGGSSMGDALSQYLSELDFRASKRGEEERRAARDRETASAVFESEALRQLQTVATYAQSKRLPEGWGLEARHTGPRVLELCLNTPHGDANVFLEAASLEEGVRITWVKDRAPAKEDVARFECVPLAGLTPPFVDDIIKELAAEATAGATSASG